MRTADDDTLSREFGYEVRHRNVYGEDLAQMVAWRMIGLSAWFDVTPLPDGWWRFVYKPEWDKDVDTIVSESMNEIQS